MAVSTTEIAIELPAVARSVRRGRDFVRRWLRERATDYDEDAVLLLTSELLTNALLHANGGFELRVADRAGRLRVEVVDESAETEPVLTRADVEALHEHGRGLQLVNALADRWGSHVLTRSGGIRSKVVWFEVSVDSKTDAADSIPHQQRRGN